MSNENTSTVQSAIDNITGSVQSGIGNLVGNPSDQRAGQAKKDKAEVKNNLSHSTVKAPGLTATADGVARDDPNRQEGAWNQTVGAGKEFVGNLVGSEQLKREGHEQNLDGKGQEAKGQLNDLGSGIADRVGGSVQGAFAGISGDSQTQAEAQRQHDLGKTRERGAEYDIQKQNH